MCSADEVIVLDRAATAELAFLDDGDCAQWCQSTEAMFSSLLVMRGLVIGLVDINSFFVMVHLL
jgi:hypothetical protein